MKGAELALTRRREFALWNAWHVAALQRTSRFPKLKDLLRKPSGPGRGKQTPDEIRAIFLAHFDHMKANQ